MDAVNKKERKECPVTGRTCVIIMMNIKEISTRMLVILLAAATIIAFTPAVWQEAYAESGIVIAGKTYSGTAASPVYGTTDDETGAVSDPVTAEPSDSKWNIKYDGTTLTLKNATITAGNLAYDGTGMIYSTGDLSIYVIGSDNKIKYTTDSGNDVYGIHSKGKMFIDGNSDAKLSVNVVPGVDSSYGIYSEGMMSFGNCGVTATGGTAKKTAGIYSKGNIYTGPGYVIGHGGSSTKYITVIVSYGIYAGGNIATRSGPVQGTGGINASGSCGIAADSLNSNGGSIKATGGDTMRTKGTYSAGISVTGNCVFMGSEGVRAVSGSGPTSYGIGAGMMSISASAGKIEAYGADSYDNDNDASYGIKLTGDSWIAGGDITARGSTSGVKCEKNVHLTVKGGILTSYPMASTLTRTKKALSSAPAIDTSADVTYSDNDDGSSPTTISVAKGATPDASIFTGHPYVKIDAGSKNIHHINQYHKW